MKLKLKNVRIAFPSLFERDEKYDRFGAQFRFSKESGYKELLENAIDNEGKEVFGAKWADIKKALTANNKIFKIHDGASKGYDDDYFVGAHNKDERPDVVGRSREALHASDRVIYSGCRVDAHLAIAAFRTKKGDAVLAVRLIGVQFRGDDAPYTASVKVEKSDYDEITDDSEGITSGIDEGDL